MFFEIVWNALLAVAGTAIVWVSSVRLEAASQRIAEYHGIPEIVKGAVITAVASSFPELSSVVIATLVHGEFELGVAGIIGSAIFNVLVIPSLSVLIGGRLRANRDLVYKEALFYLVAITGLLLTFSLAVIYFRVDGEAIRGRVTRGLALIPIGIYGIYLFLQFQDMKEDPKRSRQAAQVQVGRQWMLILACMVAIAAGVEMLVRSALNFGRLLNTPSFLWGVTIVAAGSSLPDLFISIKAARKGRSLTSLSNVLGSNTFDLLVAVPVGVLLGGAAVVNFSRAAPTMGCLTLATFVLFICMRRDLNLIRGEALLLLLLYGLFVVWIVLESFGVLNYTL